MKYRLSIFTLLFLVFLLSFFGKINTATAQAQSPDVFLPHRIGEQFTAHHQLVDYFEHLAENSPNTMLLQRYGTTHEERPLMVAIFSSPENMKNLESIRSNHLAAAGFGEIKGKKENIAVVWLSMSVHGNEPSGSECSPELAYRLATQSDPNIQQWLQNTVVVLDPSVNPDGYSRYSHWYRGASSTHVMPNPEAREHDEPWPGGRVNHYYFDLNRDWAWATQVESRQRLAVYQQWLPHVHADLHEQYVNNPYYFAPAAEPLHHFITPFQRTFQETIGQNHAGYFDENGWLYFTREVFDLFYPSYGDTYPMFNGAIGMTYEQAGHSTAGRAIQIMNGDTLRLYDRILHHLTTSLSTIETASRNAEQLNGAFAAYFKNAAANPPGEYRTFVIKKDNDGAALEALISLLKLHNIKVQILNETRGSMEGFDYKTGKNGRFSLENGDLVVSAYQPQAILTQVLFEPEGKLSDTLTYDITAWSLPFAYGLNAYAVKQKVEADDAAFILKSSSPLVQYEGKMPYAWCVPASGLASLRFVAKMKQRGVQMRYAKADFSTNSGSFEAGTIVITKADNKHQMQAIGDFIHQVATEASVPVSIIEDSWANGGPNFGSEAFALIDNKPIAVAFGEDIDPNAYGFAWHFLEQDLDMPFVALDVKKMLKTDLSKYSAVVLPEGQYKFSEDDLQALKKYAKEGGKLLVIGEATKAFEGEERGFDLVKVKYSDEKNDLQPYSSKDRRSISQSLPGAVVGVELDNSHPLLTAMPDHYFTLKTSPLAFEIPEKADVLGHIPSDYQHFGFIGGQIKPTLANSAVIVSKKIGEGQAVFFADDPLFRGFWHQGKVLFGSVLLF